jgi:hypothetical protein
VNATDLFIDQIQLARRWKLSHRTLERWRWIGCGPNYTKLVAGLCIGWWTWSSSKPTACTKPSVQRVIAVGELNQRQRSRNDAPACRSCRFFHPEITATSLLVQGYGECRAQPPEVALENESHTGNRVWPAVYEADWCGTHRADDLEEIA